MSPLAIILAAVDGLSTLLSATARLKRAAAATELPGYPGTRPQLDRPLPPPPPLGHSGVPEALAYVRGRDDAMAECEAQLRAGAAFDEFARQAAAGDEGEPEQPTGGDDGNQ